MPSEALEKLLPYYRRELQYLREMGQTFAEEYPKVARRLEMGDQESPDPHTERIIESLAFLSGRVQYNIERDMPRITTGLLGTLYPQLVAPIPAQSIVQFDVDLDQGVPADGTAVPAETTLYLDAPTDETCRFRTAYPLTLWPFSVTEADVEPRDQYEVLEGAHDVESVLRLRIRCDDGTWADYGTDQLRLHLAGDPQLTSTLYELLFAHRQRVVLLGEDQRAPEFLPDGALRPVGFDEDETTLPYPEHAHEAYRLIQEYATFPRKYLFGELHHLDRVPGEDYVDVLFLLDRSPDDIPQLAPRNVRLNCTPAVNLFHRTTEPVRVDQRQVEYRLVADRRREETTEIHSVEAVRSARDPDAGRTYRPYFSFDHQARREAPSAFWYMERRPHRRHDGTDVVISFVDPDLDPTQPADETVFGHVLCTNRRLPEEVPPQALYTTELGLPVASITGVDTPTNPIDPPLGGEHLWQLVSNLSLNHLSLSSRPESLEMLREMLRLYSGGAPSDFEQQLEGLRAMSTEPVSRRLRDEAWRGFSRGTEVHLTVDERPFAGSSAFLLGAVLNRVFGLHASANAFTQLAISSNQRDGVWHRWPPRAGDQALL
ncbi:MAG: type VI secretion system baseplate subunit TssF [Candidatus Bipolaricaulia bacterium]